MSKQKNYVWHRSHNHRGLPQAGRGKEKTMAFYIALLAAALLWMGWYGWRVDRKVDEKVRRLQSQCKAKEPRLKEREDSWRNVA